MQTYFVQAGNNPTTDFYFPQRNRADEVDHTIAPSTLGISVTDTVIFIRYIPKAWFKYLSCLSKVERPTIIFFMDDDLFDLAMHKGLPWRYRWKLYTYAGKYESWLKQIGAQLWVSTEWLAAKYKSWQPVCIPPQNPYVSSSAQQIVFYHGSASHEAEIKWLIPVIEQVLGANNKLNFEIIGTKKIRDLFKHIDRVQVLHPMAWYSYQALINTPGRIIGLAPLLDTPFNQARSASKFFDITQAGAVGIYADHPVYTNTITHQRNGYLLPMQKNLWVEQILLLANDAELRYQLVNAAKNVIK